MEQTDRFTASLTDDGRYRLLIEAVTDYAIYMLDASGIVTSWNPGAQRFKGYSAAEIIGQHFSRFYSEEDQKAGLPARALETARREGKFEAEGWRIRKDGTRFWAYVVIDPIRGQSGEIIGYAKITRDLTERRAAEQTLRQSQEQFRLLVDGVTDYAIYLLDTDGRVTTWNRGAQRIKGYLRDEIVGQHFSKFYTEQDRAAGMPQRALETAEREGRFEKEGLRVRKDGSQFWAHVVIDPVRDDRGQIIGYAKVTRDITERRDAEEKLERTREALLQSQKMEVVGQLTGGVAHDFNNLLQVIAGNLEVLQRNLPENSGRLRRAADNAMNGARRATILTQRLLAFSRKQPLQPKPIKVNELVAGMSELLHRSLGETVAVETVLGAGVWRTEADPNQLESALLNLAVNARDAMPDGGKLTIETANAHIDEGYAAKQAEVTPGQYVVICVSDTGTGMDKATISRVFEPFFTTKEPGKGTGLGLSQVYGFVKQSGGHVKIYLEKDQGTRVKIYLRRMLSEDLQESDATDAPVPEGTKGETILVVEDDDDVRAYSVDILRELGYRVIDSHDGPSALRLLERQQKVDMLFCDVVLPGGFTGAQVAAQAQILRPGLRVLFTTGYARNAIVHHGRLDAGVQLITKPFTFAELAAKVRDVMDKGADSRPDVDH